MSIFFIEDKNGNYFSADGKRRFIRLKGKAAYDYLKSPNGRGKRFYRLSAEEETEEDVFIEIPSSKIGHIRKAERRTQYVADCKKESGRYEISLYALEANDHGERCSGEELIEDTAIDIESTAIHVCTFDNGKEITPNYLSRTFHKIIVKTDLPPIRFHDLRHSVASNLLNDGFNAVQVAEWLGHSSSTTTLKFYAHIDKTSKMSIANSLAPV